MTPQTDYKLMEWTPDRVRRFWDWQSHHPEQYFTFQFGRRIAYGLGEYLRNRDVLDYGCGIGAFLPHLCSVADRATAVDISPDSLAVARTRGEPFSNFQGAVLLSDLLQRQQQFETVVSVEVIEHLDDTALEQFLTAMGQLIKPGGSFVLTTPNDEDLTQNYVLCPVSGELFHRWQHMRSWNSDTLSRRLEEAGLVVSRVFTTDLARPPLLSPSGVMRVLHRLRHGVGKQPHLVCVGTRR